MNTRARFVLLAILVLFHVEVALPKVLRPMGIPELRELPAPVRFLRGIPSPDRRYFMRQGAAPAILIEKAMAVFLLLILGAVTFFAPSGRRRLVATWVLVGLLVAIEFLAPAAIPILARHRTGNPAFAHDGGTIQVEEACKMMLRGRNPYTEDYRKTPLKQWRGLSTPIVDHFPYFPFAVVPLVPVYALLSAIHLPDLRFFYLACAFVTGLLLAFSEKRAEAKPLLFSLPFFAPYLAKATILGTNDIYSIAFVVLAMTIFEAGHLAAGLVVLGLAMGIKQFAWLLLPLFLASLGPRIRSRPKLILAAPAALLLVTIPFLLGDGRSFLDDTFGYAMGGSQTPYPVKGVGAYGFGTLALAYGLVKRAATNHYPYILLGAVCSLALLALGSIRLYREAALEKPTKAAVLSKKIPVIQAVFALSLLPFLYFSRYFHANFLGYALFFLLVGIVRTVPEEADSGIG